MGGCPTDLVPQETLRLCPDRYTYLRSLTSEIAQYNRFYRLAQGNLLSQITLGFGSPQQFTANGLFLKLQGPVGSTYEIDASSDLIHWLSITSILLPRRL
jgi:hypothetical protein